ncbi:MAG: hypothetical protein E7393_06025 [Ruminococcaceae bacterium]|nr:hypothetical protein [Oscillospiraceae bacterium]
MYKDLDIFYFSATHWDREWYQSFQGFRYRLVDLVDHLIELLDKDQDYKTFHFDGQTIVLEDYTEIRPEMAEKLKQYIAEGRIIVGPWYVMPDEYTVSGESLIRNLMLGHEIAQQWGGESWKYGYICDIFGHIAQMPQIFNGFDIRYSTLGRGTTESDPTYFNWQSPDGSYVKNFKLCPEEGYGEFRSAYSMEKDKTVHNPVIVENIKAKVDAEIKRAGDIPIVVLMDGIDHAEAAVDTTDYIKEIAKQYPGARVHHINLCEQGKLLEKYELPTIEGELCKTVQFNHGYLQLLTNTLSSYYTLKKENDECQTIMEKWFEPMGVFADFEGKKVDENYAKLAYKTLIMNHPHDSICGCSIDRVPQDMEYRFAQVKEIYTTVSNPYIDSFARDNAKQDEPFVNILTFFNPLPFAVTKTVTVDVDFEPEYPKRRSEGFGYESINSFRIYDEGGREIPYEIIDIKRNLMKPRYARFWKAVDVHTVSLTITMPPCGTSEYLIKPAETASVRYLSKITSGQNFMENKFIKVTILPNGSIEIFDKKTNKTYSQLGNLVDDGEIGDGWNHCNPTCDSAVSTINGSSKIEKIENGPSRCVFKVTRKLEVPANLVIDKFGKRRSEEQVELVFVTKIGLSEEARYVDVELFFDNVAKDHRLRYMMSTGIDEKTYFAGQAFCCVNRNVGVNLDTQDWKEHDQYEKSTNGILGKRDNRGNGIAFVSAYGLHECAAFDDAEGTLAVTLLRSFKNTVRTSGETKCQLNVPLQYKFALVPVDSTVAYGDLLKLQDIMATGVRTVLSKVDKDCVANKPHSFMRVDGKNIATSVIKRAADGSGDIIVRVFNTSDKKSQATVELACDIKKAQLVNLNEEFISNVNPEGNQVAVDVGPWKIVTLKISKN